MRRRGGAATGGATLSDVTTAVVLVGGAMPDRHALEGVAEADIVVAVDSGVRIARKHGLPVHVLIGDLDSASDGDRAWAIAEEAELIEHPEDKDATDLELALDHLKELDVDRILAVGVEGGRLDHELGNWAVLCRPQSALVEIRTPTGKAYLLNGDGANELDLDAELGDLVTLLPVGGVAKGVWATGVRWPLDGATLEPGSTLGVSNEITEETGYVSVESGTLLVVRPVPE